MGIRYFAQRALNQLDREELLNSFTVSHKVLSKKWIKQKYRAWLSRNLGPKELFDLIYSKKLWGSTESVSGTGSTLQATVKIRNVLPDLFIRLESNSILDIPCGDFNWMKHLDLSNIHYIGADIVPDLIENNLNLNSIKNREFLILDLITDKLPKADIVLCRDCLVHLSNQNIHKALSNIKSSGAKYLLTTHFPDHLINKEIGTDYWRPINLEEKPFNLPPPVLLINESHKEPGLTDKSLGLWQIKDL